MEQNYWRKCVVCKKPINFSSKYFKCSVTSCDKKRAPVQFCSVECWDVHRSIMSHKSAGADEYQAPSKAQWEELEKNESKVRIVKATASEGHLSAEGSSSDEDILVVVSKMKAYVKTKSGLNTSADVNQVLSEIIREACDRAIQNAHRDSRKTLMARDFR